MHEKLNITVNEGVSTLEIVSKTPIENFQTRKGINVCGQIDVPYQHLRKVTQTIIEDSIGYRELHLSPMITETVKTSFLLISRDERCIEFVENAGNVFQSQYTGRLEFDENFKKFNINQNEEINPFALAEKIKMNRSFFESKTEAMKLVSILMGFEAKVNREIEAKDDGRANKRALFAQTVQTNLPEGFKLKLPIFKGMPAVVFEVEIAIDSNNLQCRLISPEVNDFINEQTDAIIDEQIEKIVALHPELRIFEK